MDSPKNTKIDWIMWTATMSSDKETFQKFSGPVYKYINETVSRVPISDGILLIVVGGLASRARSVIGGYWMQVLMNKLSGSK
ncbi:DUF1793 domain-containing protein [Bacteroides ovatus]|nr:DUF1793 domain-containing protein [Bacteroides ovatus]